MLFEGRLFKEKLDTGLFALYEYAGVEVPIEKTEKEFEPDKGMFIKDRLIVALPLAPGQLGLLVV